MRSLDDYELNERVAQRRGSATYRGTQRTTRDPVVLEIVPRDSTDVLTALARCQREYEIGRAIEHESVVRYLDCRSVPGAMVLLQEDFGGVSLENAIVPQGMDIALFLDLAVQLAAALAAIHAHGVIHAALEPRSIFVNLKTRTAKLAAFGDAFRFHHDSPAASTEADLDALAYEAPEQSGRMTRVVDYRADLYALGATFYCMLCGEPPFRAQDALALAHCHIARTQEPLDERRPAVPPVLARIVDKLLAKDPRDRYQGAHGLSADLLRCRSQRDQRGHISAFVLGQDDIPARVELPDRVYGRDSEHARLLQAFERVRRGALGGIVWVTGETGSGKSALVRTLARSVGQAGGIFLSGKVEQGRVDEPYAGLSSAVAEWVQKLLAEPADVLADCRQRLTTTLGANLPILVEALPVLEKIVGAVRCEKPSDAERSAFSKRARLRFAFTSFMGLLADARRPVVVFLDDLQWASSALTQLLTSALVSGPLPHLLLIGGYRSEEVDVRHPLSHLQLALGKARVASETLELGGLGPSHVAELLADSLHTDTAEVAELAQLVWQQAGSSPFAIRTFVLELEAQHQLRLDSSSGRWTWDLASIRSANIQGALQPRLERLPTPTREALWVASCVGSTISVSTLSALLGRPQAEIWRQLLPALRDQLVLLPEAAEPPRALLGPTPRYPALRFSHDRVQQACGALPVAGDVRALHGRIGLLLLESWPVEQREAHIFAIVDQLNQGHPPDVGSDAARRLSQLNASAGKRARASAAYAEGLGYYERALAVLDLPEAWSAAHDLAFAIQMGLAECAGVMDDAPRARATFELVSSHVRDHAERIAVVRAWVVLEASVGAFDGVIELVRKALSEFGVTLPSTADLAANPAPPNWDRTERMLREHTADELLHWPDATSDQTRVVLELLAEVIPAAYFVNKPLMGWVVLKSLEFTLENGFTKTTPYCLASYAMHLMVRMRFEEDPARAVELGHIAMRLTERFMATDRGRIHYIFGIFLAHWEEHADASVEHIRAALTRSLEMGDLFHARLAALMLPIMLIQTGKNVEAVSQASKKKADLRAYGKNALFTAFARSLRGLNTEPTRLELANLNEQGLSDAVTALGGTSLAHYQVLKLELLVLHESWPSAVALVRRWDELIRAEIGRALFGVDYVFLSALALVAQLRETGSESSQSDLRAMLAERRIWLASWSARCPSNFGGKHCLVEAECCDLEGERSRAAELYDVAIEAETRSGFTHELAMVYERAAAFYRRRHRLTHAKAFLEEAREAYLRWGAIAKAQELAAGALLAKSPTSGHRGEELDLISVIKASQALSRETRLYDLVQRVLQISAENAGAERALLVVLVGDELRVAACSPMCGESIDPEQGVPLAAQHEVSAGILRYVLRTGESLVLDNALEEGAFTEDPTVRAARARSILAIPLSSTNAENGVLYLENRLTPRAFMRERLALLEMLIRQARILIDNARFLQRTQRLNTQLEAENRQRQHAEVELRVSERRLAGFLDGMPVGVLILAPERKLHFMNDVAEQILGMDAPTASRRGLPSLYRSDSPEAIATELLPSSRALRGETVSDDNLEVHRGETSVPLNVWASPFRDTQGRVEFAIVAFQDVTHAKQAAEQRARLEERVRQAQKMESTGQLASGVAHDLNNMLVPILGFVDLAIRANEHEQVVEYLGHVQQAAGQAAELTRGLLAFARQQVLTMAPLDLSREVTGIQRILDSVVREDIQFVRELASDLPSVQADRSQLRQVLMNLVVNACDAMPQGGRLVLSTRHAVLRAPLLGAREVPPGDYVVLTVSDTGEGMDRATQGRVFEPFFTTKPQGKGVGLGLAMSLGIVEQHRGYVRVESTRGHGTAFEVWLPSVSGEASPEVSVAAAVRSTKHTDRLMLVVEDDDGVRRFIERALRETEVQLLVAKSPSEVLELTRRDRRVPDAVITDLVLPEMNGRKLFAILRERYPKLRGLFISGYAANIVSDGDQLPPDTRFLAKPFSLAQVRQSLDELLGS